MDALLQALAASRRREILRLVRRRERSAGEIHRALGDVTFGAVSQHLAVLEQAGLVRARREGRSRYYCLRGAGLAPLRAWLDSMWSDALGRLKQLAEADADAEAEAEAEARAPAGREPVAEDRSARRPSARSQARPPTGAANRYLHPRRKRHS